ncbi:3-oxoacyl-[acyl-carrier-protein] synthase III C-terminal domain-containing protein [Kamptonema sp. UHCC 0994]|uniref:3-oxoacyl-ACP synthase III family protein n=1 Tax=Kamptonema sp. UHCC 0994 TaxID=3031329 RepID=UPI0023BA0F93|nr:3-oxoacyl-[acyl-carrier-protein] synthase III C-terminal domain-containing protein [Kamptonema sp. UHCC 0994]MDF0554171.1 3-oxoacyl-[acyl-carrier-protein] synthase III C-terminal domain-containing protein [Kamptonema sp. UHCC 0994]
MSFVKMNQAVGIRAIAVNFPERLRTNDYWKKNYPGFLAELEQKNQKVRLFDNDSQENINWVQAVKPYREDIFRGTLERRVLAEGETSISLECGAIQKVLQASKLEINDVDLLISCAMFSEQLVIGNATLIARELGFRGVAWNLNTSCAGALSALSNAVALVQNQNFNRVLVSLSCNYSKHVEYTNSFSFTVGDGAAAFIVEKSEEGQGLIHSYSTNTYDTCDVVYPKFTVDSSGQPRTLITVNKETVKYATSLFVKYFQKCCTQVLIESKIKIEEIDFFICFAAAAGYADFCALELNISKSKTIDIFPMYANISCVSVIAALYHAAELKKIQQDDLVMIYSHGFSGSSVASIMRWGDVALGPAPTPSENLIATLVGAR